MELGSGGDPSQLARWISRSETLPNQSSIALEYNFLDAVQTCTGSDLVLALRVLEPLEDSQKRLAITVASVLNWLTFHTDTEERTRTLRSFGQTPLKVAMCALRPEAATRDIDPFQATIFFSLGLLTLRSFGMLAAYQRFQQLYATHAHLYEDSRRRRLLTRSWVGPVGHLVTTAYLLANNRLEVETGTPPQPLVLQRARSDNSFLFKLVSEQFKDQFTTNVEQGNLLDLGEDHVSLAREWVGERALAPAQFCAHVFERLRKRHHNPSILSLPSSSREKLTEFLSKRGLADRPIVSLHVRDDGYRVRQSAGVPTDWRSVSIEAYHQSIEWLRDKGYCVILYGHRGMTPLPEMDGVIDWPVLQFEDQDQSAELQIAAMATASFHVGTSSGMSLVPLLFDRPCIFTNWAPVGLVPWGRSRIVLKNYVNVAADSPITDETELIRFAAMMSRPLAEQFGVAAKDLTAEQNHLSIRNFVQELEAGQIWAKPGYFRWMNDSLVK